MFVNIKKDGKTIACYRKDLILWVEYSNGRCLIQPVEGSQCTYTMTEQDFSDLVSQLNAY